MAFEVRPVGRVESPLGDRDAAPHQGDEGAPEAWIAFDPAVAAGAARPARRRGRPRADLARSRSPRRAAGASRAATRRAPEQGVFSTRSPDRPNPIGLHRVTIVEVEGLRLRVRDLEALDGTPVLDVKPVLDPGRER